MRTRPTLFACLCPLALLLATTAELRAASIGLSFSRDSAPVLLNPGDSAGGPAVAQVNWNSVSSGFQGGNNSNLSPASATLVDNTGTASGITVSWAGDTTWSTNNGTSNGDNKMMNGYLDDTGSAPSTTTFTNIPYSEYDVYVFFGSDGNGRTGTVSDGTTSYSYTTNSNTGGTFPGSFVQTSDTGGGNPNANYAVFAAKNGSSLTITNTRGSNNVGVHGIQIVETVVIPGLPDVETLTASGVTSSGATLRGNLIDNGDGADVATLTFYWGPSDGGTTPASWSSTAPGGTRTSQGPFTAPLGALSPNTTYFFRAFASNSAGTDWATDSESFTTPAALPTIANIAASDILGTSATIGGTVTSTGGDLPTLVIHYGDNDAGTGTWDSQLSLGQQNGAATGGISGLAPGTNYFFRAAATNSAGTAWATASSSFSTTPVTVPSITNSPATGINGTFATLNGDVTDPGGDPPAVTIFYGTSDGGNVAGNWELSTFLGNETGGFARNVTNLQPTTTYFFRAFAQNVTGSAWAPTSLSFTTPVFVPPSVVINEIHYDEDTKTVRAEFIELFNPSESAVDLSGYSFSSGVDFLFPSGSVLPAGGYLVVAEDPATMATRYGFNGALGPFANGTNLKNSGETITLSDSAGSTVDEVTYKLGFPWPIVGDDLGTLLVSPSIELINPLLDNDIGGSWRASGFPVATVVGGGGGGSPVNYIASNAVWNFLADGSDQGTAWRVSAFDDSLWESGAAELGYGDGDEATVVDSGPPGSRYATTYFRRTANIPDPSAFVSFTISITYDDSYAVYVNGTEVARHSGLAANAAFDDYASNTVGDNANDTLSLPVSAFMAGDNVVAVEVHQSGGGSSDVSFALSLTGEVDGGTPSGSFAPTPGAANRSLAATAPPQIRQVDHFPESPNSGQSVLVTAKISDPDGVGPVALQYQIVEPGDYFCRYFKFNNNGTANADPRYENPANWTSIAMSDDGSGSDVLAADSIYSVALPASLQTNRRLIRYRITAEDSVGTTITVPYSDDPQPNFAYFVYDGTPDWSGVIRPGDTAVNFPGSLMSSVATYFLLSTNSWVDDSQFGGYGGSEYLWPGTMIYDGKVYDHIQYRPRGGVHRYQYGKNFWKFDFPRGHRFEARDRYGKRYKSDWNKLNFSSIVQQVNFNHRGEQGLFESVGFKLFQLAGVEACNTHYSQFYVIDETSPTGANQYESDYYGLYLSIEQLDGGYLDEHGLPDGNLYKIEGNSGTSNNQGPTQVSDGSDVGAFISTSNGTPTAQWWEDNLDVEKYLSYRTIVEGIHHYDIAGGKNFFYYHNPVTDKFEVHPWDLDLTWADNMYGSGNHPFKSKVAENGAFNTDYQNRVREIKDLLYNSDEGWRVIDEMVRDVWTPGAPSLVGADRRQWDNNPRITSADRYYDVAGDNDFSGMIQVLKNYIVSRGNWMTSNLLTQESGIPTTPTLTYSGGSGFPSNDLKFTSSAYDSGTAFAAMEWRISEIYNEETSNYVAGERYIYEIDGATASGELTTFDSDYLFPALSARPGKVYRARVRHKDSAGRSSHWSAPVEFLVSAPDVTPYVDALRITEVHYHPNNPTAAEQAMGWVDSDFEFIEMQNISTAVVDLTDVRFTKGVDFDFTASTLLQPGAYVLIVKNQAAFESRYGAVLPVAGEWAFDQKLSNGGENLKLSLGSGTAIIDFTYNDLFPWPTSPDGGGFSLTLNCPDQTLPAAHVDPLAWRASRLVDGSPGADDHLDFASWAVENGLGAGADLTADGDGDSLINLLEYAFASDPTVGSVSGLPTASHGDYSVGGNVDQYLTLAFSRQAATKDLAYFVEISNDLNFWQTAPVVKVSTTSNVDGTVSEIWRAANPVGADPRNFMRVRVEGATD